MMDHDCFPNGIDLKESLEFYFQLCSMETKPDAHAVMAATLALGSKSRPHDEHDFELDFRHDYSNDFEP